MQPTNQQQMQFALPPGQTAMPLMINTQPKSNIKEHYLATCVRGLSITQIILGCLAFILQISEIINGSDVAAVGAGIWTGIFFIIAGALGVMSSSMRTTCSIVAFLVMSIIAAVITVGLLATSAVGLGVVNEERRYRYSYSSYNPEASLALYAILLLISLVEAVVAIISSCYACHGLCCGKSSNQGVVIMPGNVQYVVGPNGQTQIIITPSSQGNNVMASGSGQYGPNPTGQYGPNPTGQYGPNPTGHYGQNPTGHYGQNPTGQHGEETKNPNIRNQPLLVQTGEPSQMRPGQPMPDVYHPAPVHPAAPPAYDHNQDSPPPRYTTGPTTEA